MSIAIQYGEKRDLQDPSTAVKGTDYDRIWDKEENHLNSFILVLRMATMKVVILEIYIIENWANRTIDEFSVKVT